MKINRRLPFENYKKDSLMILSYCFLDISEVILTLVMFEKFQNFKYLYLSLSKKSRKEFLTDIFCIFFISLWTYFWRFKEHVIKKKQYPENCRGSFSSLVFDASFQGWSATFIRSAYDGDC